MYYELLISLYRAFVFSTYVDSLWIASRTHSFLSLTGTCAEVVMHAWDHYIAKA